MTGSGLPTTDRPARLPIVVFCGKGGVGKTTLSLALGLGYARSGRSVVVVSSQPLPDLAMTVSLERIRAEDPAAAANLMVTYIDAREILAAMFERQFPSTYVARKVLTSSIYKSLIEIAPGLKEIAFLSRLRELADTRLQPAGGAIDALIWDAPATGHFLETLNVTRKFEMYLSGPFAQTGRELQQYFSERANLLLIPVTTLEEMAVEETVELWRTLEHGLRIHPAGIACNLVSPMLQASAEATLNADTLTGLPPREAADLAFVLDRHRIERDELDTLRSSLPGPFHLVRRVPQWSSDLELLSAVSAQLTIATATPG